MERCAEGWSARRLLTGMARLSWTQRGQENHEINHFILQRYSPWVCLDCDAGDGRGYPFTALLQGSISLDTALVRMDALNVLEDDVLYTLNDLQLNEGYHVFAIQYEYPPENYIATVEQDYASISQLLDELLSDGHFSSELGYAPEVSDMVDEFQRMLDTPHHFSASG
jgi:hypothetical protein